MRELAEGLAPKFGLFVIDVTVNAALDIEITVDAVERVALQQCAELSKTIEPMIDPEIDFSLTVFSAGIGQPIKDHRQLDKIIGKPIEITLKAGAKIKGVLVQNNTTNNPTLEGTIVFQYNEKQPNPLQPKKKIDVEISKTIDVAQEAKAIIELLDIK